MKLFLLSICLVAAAQGANIVDPDTCTSFPCLIFSDDFDTFDHKAWLHEIGMGGGGNGEFEMYLNNRSISYTKDSTLFIKPSLVSQWHDEEFLQSGSVDLWGGAGVGDVCTGNMNTGCHRYGAPDSIINPIMSARIRTLGTFDFRYGRFEVRAKMPRGDWLWPAIWLLPTGWPYGLWPASGEIDVAECRGNDEYGEINNNYAGSTLHWGPYYPENRFELTTSKYQTNGSFADDFHVWAFEWNDNGMQFYLDGDLVMTVDPGTSFWDLGGFDELGDIDNIWENEGKMAPFNQNFYIIMNLAVGGTGGFFPDGVSDNKPWNDGGTQAEAFGDFWNARDQWYPTWSIDGTMNTKVSEDAALQVDYVRVYKTSNVEY